MSVKGDFPIIVRANNIKAKLVSKNIKHEVGLRKHKNKNFCKKV